MNGCGDLKVQHRSGECQVRIQRGLFSQVGDLLAEQRWFGARKRCAIITDSNVGRLYGVALQEMLSQAGFQPTYVEVPAGETSKTLANVGAVADQLAAARLDRQSFVIGLGGGVVGDLSGFVSSIYYRGIPHAQIPTTVIAQADSAIGGKTGVNTVGGKNLLGAFHPPRAVLVDSALLDSLPQREFSEGFAEVIKHGVIADRDVFARCLSFQRNDTDALLRRSLEIKAGVVNEDEFETTGVRARLNFGHTIGHGIEQAAGYGRLLHGEAISLGMVAAAWLSVRHAGLPEREAREITSCLERFDLPTRLPDNLSTQAVLNGLLPDKKFEEGKIRFVLTPGIGKAFLSEPGALDVEEIRRAIDCLHS